MSETSVAKKWWIWLGISFVVILLDQITKIWISGQFQYAERYNVLSVFDLTLAHNTGAAFSFLHDAGGMQRWLFSGIAVAASIWITILLRQHSSQKLFAWALALILGGALGNLIDRVSYGYVVDFLLFYWNDSYFPAFNIADSAITCGAILMIIDSFKNPQKSL